MHSPLLPVSSSSKSGRECSFANIVVSLFCLLAAVTVILHDNVHFPSQRENQVAESLVKMDVRTDEMPKKQMSSFTERLKTKLMEEQKVAESREVPVGAYGCEEGFAPEDGQYAAGLTTFTETVIKENAANVKGTENVLYTAAAEYLTKGNKDLKSFQDLTNFHTGNHVFATDHAFAGLNPVPIVSIAIAALLETIPQLQTGDGKLVKFMINAVVKIIGLWINIALFGTVWWIAVPLAAVFLLMSFMGETFDAGSVGKTIQDALKKPGNKFNEMMAEQFGSMKKFTSARTIRVKGGDGKFRDKGGILGALAAFAQGIKEKADAAAQSQIFQGAAKIASTIGSLAEKGLDFASSALKWASCMLTVSLGLETAPELTQQLQMKADVYFTLQYQPWNCQAKGFYSLAGYSGEFDLCCKQPVVGGVVKDLEDVGKPLTETEICSMWTDCCTKEGKRGGSTSFDIPCCQKSGAGGSPSSSMKIVYPKKESSVRNERML